MKQSRNEGILKSVLYMCIHVLVYCRFLEWMYPSGGGEENVESAALGILILWTTW